MAEINPLVSALQGMQQPVMQQPGLGQAQRQQQIANLLLQSGQRTDNPLVAALTGFFGAQAGMRAAEQFGNIEQQQMQAEAERLARQEGREEKRLGLEERRLEQQDRLAREEISLKRQQIAQELKLAQLKLKDQGIELTEGQKAVDRNFAKEFVSYNAAGGYADVAKNLNQLKEVRDGLRNGKISTGAETRIVPEFAESLLLPSTVGARQAVEEVAQRNLKLVLGGQFAQKEGEQLIKRAYNQDLSEEENAKRLDRLIASIEEAALAKQAASEYFARNGTLTGFAGIVPSLSTIESSFENKVKEQGGAETPPKAAFVFKDGKLVRN